jgi:transglutaminase-like putative cysteine protease
MDFSAWFEVYLSGRWYSFDARHNQSRIGRITIGRGRDAVDVPITMVFGRHKLEKFTVITEELKSDGDINPEPKSSCLQELAVEIK